MVAILAFVTTGMIMLIRRLDFLFALFLSVGLPGCTKGSKTTSTPSEKQAAQEVAAQPDLRADMSAAQVAYLSQWLDAPATTERLTHPFSLEVKGKGTDVVGEVSVKENLVSMELDGARFSGMIQERQNWADFSLVLYQVLLVSADEVRVAWLYCEGERLTWTYHEGSRSPMRNERMEGTCVARLAPTTAQIDLVAVKMSAPNPLKGYRVNGGEQIQIYEDGSRQSFARVGRERYRLYPFERVDCSKACGSPGWHEVHTLVERERDDALGFIIFYLRDEGEVTGEYGVVWPGFDPLRHQKWSATWRTP